jgi:thiamine transport system permease protein
MKAKFLLSFLLIYFFSPLLILFTQFKLTTDFPVKNYIVSFSNSIIQSVIVVCFCLLFSTVITPFLADFKPKKVKKILQIALLPLVLPSLFTFLILFSYFQQFPFGLLGISLTFVVIYLGFSLHLIYHAYIEKVAPLLPIIKTYNIGFFQHIRLIDWPLLREDLIQVTQFIFLGCMTSLSVPLLAGGGKSINLELFVFESIFIDGNWAIIVYLAVLQIIYLYLFQSIFKFLSRKKIILSEPARYFHPVKPRKISNFALVMVFSYLFFYCGGFLYQVGKAFIKIKTDQLLLLDFSQAFLNTLLLSIATFVLVGLLIVSLLYLQFKNVKYDWIYNLMLPSSVVVGIAYFVLFSFGSGFQIELLKISFGLVLLYGLALIKSYLAEPLNRLQNYFNVAHIYQIGFFTFLVTIFYPQVKKSLLMMGTLLTLYCFFEFSFLKVVSVESLYTGQYIERLISTYRLEHGFIYSFILMLFLALPYLFLSYFLSKGKNVSH